MVKTFFQDSLQALERELYGPSAFPTTVTLGTRTYEVAIWEGQSLPDQLLAYDCETAKIEANEVPRLALATAYGDARMAIDFQKTVKRPF